MTGGGGKGGRNYLWFLTTMNFIVLFLLSPNQVTEGAPTFATDSKFGDLLVVVVPRQGPRIVGARER